MFVLCYQRRNGLKYEYAEFMASRQSSLAKILSSYDFQKMGYFQSSKRENKIGDFVTKCQKIFRQLQPI